VYWLTTLLAVGWLASVLEAGGVPEALPWQTVPGGRCAVLSLPSAGKTGFTILDPVPLGIGFTNRLAQSRYLTNQVLLNGSGVAAGDVDGDGWCDLYFCSIDGASALFRNLGNWRFEDITATAGVACPGQSATGAALADVDGDGDLDLLVTGIGAGTRLFRNDGAMRFTEVTRAAGLLGGTGACSMALADVDGDGDLDLYVVNYRTTTFRDEPPKRFSVATANNRFELVAVDGRPVSTPELRGRFSVDRVTGVLENGEADVLYRNDGQGRFTPVDWADGTFRDEEGRPVPVPYDWGLSAMFRDLNGDGAPDLYVCNDFHSPDRIWINDGRGRFRALPRLAIRQTSIFSMGLDVADVDRDGHDDLFVADMFSRRHDRRQVQLMDRQPTVQMVGSTDDRPQYSRNTLLHSRGDGTYAEIAQYAGVESADWCWCPVFLDVDLDGFEDILCVTGHVRDAQNIDIARRIDELTRARKLSWGEQLQLRGRFERLEVPNYAFRNRGNLTFEEVGKAWGFDSLKVSQGVALADFDRDGDLDVVVNCLTDGPLLGRNDSTRPRVAVRLRGRPPNTEGIGARITVRQAGLPPQSQEIMAGGRYVSSDEPMRVFAAAGPEADLTIEVHWRSGKWSRLVSARPNRVYELEEAGADATPPALVQPPAPWFVEVSGRLAHRHAESPFDDFQQQPLLPHKFSQLGPGVTWFDVDGDGWEDLIVGGGRGGQLAVLRNDGKGGFAAVRDAPFQGAVARDQTAVLGWHPGAGTTALLAGSANYEDGGTNGPAVRQYRLDTRTVDEGLPGQRSSTGPLALADVDGDGDLDVFVGGRVISGRCPEPASSFLLRNDGGQLRLDPGLSRAFAGVGLVSDALFTDLDADGSADLVLACQWGPLRVFRIVRGRFEAWDPMVTRAAGLPVRGLADRGVDGHVRGLVPTTAVNVVGKAPATAPGAAALSNSMESLRLSDLTGWWNSVAAGDFNGDGRMDVVAGNWGRNTKYQAHLGTALHTYYADLNEDGAIELIEAYHDPDLGKIVPLRDWGTLSRSLPFILERYASYTAFSTAGVFDVLGERRSLVADLPVATFESVLLLNRGDGFELHPLPAEAQFSPVFGLAVADFDGDGNEDVFAAQNLFAVAPLTSRCDGGVGVWLKGDGRGGFIAVPPRESGVYVYGEGRGAAVGDFDQDGRVDLAVAQNGEATKLFRNERSRPGLRMRLQGPPGNPEAVGAQVHLMYADGRRGPTREIRAGGGYWSQDSATTVLGVAGQPRSLVVRWPGGRQTETAVPERVSEISPRWE